jgi:hypothetical protein
METPLITFGRIKMNCKRTNIFSPMIEITNKNNKLIAKATY